MIKKSIFLMLVCVLCVISETILQKDQKFNVNANKMLSYISDLYKDYVKTDKPLKIQLEQLQKHLNNKNMDVTTKLSVLSTISLLSLQRKSTYFNFLVSTPFIDDETIFLFIVDCLSDSNYQIQKSAYQKLLKYGRLDMLQKHSILIKQNISLYNKAYFVNCENIHKEVCQEVLNGKRKETIMHPGAKLMTFLELTNQENELVLINLSNASDYVYLARLGIKSAEKKLIDSFNKTISIKVKRKLAHKLGRAGTDECIKTLLKSLYSTAKFEKISSNDTTIVDIPFRLDICNALAISHPELNFLDSILVMSTTPPGKALPESWEDNEGGAKAAFHLLRHIADWGQKTYGVKPDGNEPTPGEFIFFGGKLKARGE